MSQAPAWQLESLDVGYDAQRPVLRGLDAQARVGKVTAVLGPNAAGKTTLLRTLLGSLPPVAGRALLDGRPTRDTPAGALARRVAWVPQGLSDRFGFTVRELVAMGLAARGQRLTRAQAEHQAQHAMEAAGVADLAERPASRLSAGQRQRALLARALAQCGPAARSLLADEPTAALDPPHAHAALGVLRGLARRDPAPLAVVVVLHDLALAGEYADDAWLLANGRMIAAGPVADVLTPDRLTRAYGARFTSAPSPRPVPRVAVAEDA
ncbi:MAG: ABC transporter ATP-binding protein [Planctomycetota bacterium]